MTPLVFFHELFGPLRWLWFLVGACIGSFLTMLVYRLPLILQAEQDGREPSWTLSYPGSSCPACKSQLKWHQNLPFIGYALSKGHCSSCGVKIPLRYLSLEVLASAWSLLATYLWSDPTQIVAWSLFGWFLLAMGWMDAKTKWLPDVLTISFLWVGLFFSTLPHAMVNPSSAIVAAISGYLSLYAVGTVFHHFRGQEGLGDGDIKLMAAFGAWMGLVPMLYTLVVACTLTIVGSLVLKVRGQVPFGPALCISALAVALYFKY